MGRTIGSMGRVIGKTKQAANGRVKGRTTGSISLSHLADTAGAAINIIKIHSLDGVHNDSSGSHG